MVPIRNSVGSGLELDKSTVIFALTLRSNDSLDFDRGLLVVTDSNYSKNGNAFEIFTVNGKLIFT